ncbi:conserved hypothetical protein [Talaromyces stipitatus ATCC 10500]|uniref:Zn(2)-C6 fungal-type domain-containing protein n=1 Tax=Talaromyces stipitatus (strain ATCC 10500 / CBS 375.48 / QM 6759 / NRRL 1006) TaxID=441959 RepID=B8MAM3_TALSN|nr:uncharacterized protein TSTA_112790 [Talaromyces stipitatus ATCC 10500]EED17447.1 conserved hypothetical protein [Talaromyces stipitatus ATCC 10500]
MDDYCENNTESEAKRRKIRKGTRSCWECKKRKMKCEFEFLHAEEDSSRSERKGRRRVGSQDRVARVETLVEQLIRKVNRDRPSADGGAPATSQIPARNHEIPTPTSIDLDSARFLHLYEPSTNTWPYFTSNIEGLQCMMMESMYQANGGNLRRSWIANRRAMVIAQLMNLLRSDSRAQYKALDPGIRADPRFMWFRIVFHDRHLCLMLGLTQGSLDQSMATGKAYKDDSPIGRLERMHCTIASRILERNASGSSSDDFELTQSLDLELQKAGRSLPSKWWLMPNLAIVADDSLTLFWNMGQLFNQLYHYNLLNQLHLPYMLRSSPERKYEYSKMTCVNASGGILLRFIMFRSYDRADFCCRTVDFFALMAAITLLLAHLDSERLTQTGNLLAHQYLSDRAMIEQVQMNMEQISCVNGDALSAQSADLLQILLVIENETAEMDSSKPPASYDQSNVLINGMLNIESPEVAGSAFDHNHFGKKSFAESMAGASWSSVDSVGGLPAAFTSRYQYVVSDTALRQYEGPGLTAGLDDWAFQGVDMAFFDNLMKGVDEGNCF